MGIKAEQLTGRKYGRLLVLDRVENKRNGNVLWNCLCDCGNFRVNQTQTLKGGAVVSCGCLKKEKNTKHGLSSHPLFATWYLMISRCYKPSANAYMRYGGRGIQVCNRWRDSPQNFIDDMGPKPKGAQLDRINNDGDYSPENCRWATPETQCNNRRSNTVIFYRGKSQTVMQWSKELNMNRRTIEQRIRKGWTTEQIFETPVKQYNRAKKGK